MLKTSKRQSWWTPELRIQCQMSPRNFQEMKLSRLD
jgi:hypothetical protein